MKPVVALTDKERFPLIENLSFLNQLKQDVAAPHFNFQSGDRLNQQHLQKLMEYEQMIRGRRQFWEENKTPGWIEGFINYCVSTVPFYQYRPLHFFEQPTINRRDLSAAPWLFVSSTSDIEDLLVYQTSGTTGTPMDVIFDPVSQACWLPQLQSILDIYEIELSKSPTQVAIALVCFQESTLTYASLSSYLNGAGVLKINLNTADWKQASDRKTFLEKFNPEVLTGDPFAFMALMELNPNIRPKALVSSAMKLGEGLKKDLSNRFQCLVLDIYSMTECRMISFAEGNQHRAIRPDLFLEVFDAEKDVVLPYGERGELVVTGGNNPFLPLIRYRTGDFCSLKIENGIPYLVDLEAREMVVYFRMDGSFVNNIEISRAMSRLSLAGFNLHQNKDHSLHFMGWSDDEKITDSIRPALLDIFGKDISLNIGIKTIEEAPTKKPISYSSEF